MTRPKLQVNDVWILQEVIPYDGSSIEGVFFDVEVAKRGRGKWTYVQNEGEEGFWTTNSKADSYEMFFLLTKHPVRTK